MTINSFLHHNIEQCLNLLAQHDDENDFSTDDSDYESDCDDENDYDTTVTHQPLRIASAPDMLQLQMKRTMLFNETVCNKRLKRAESSCSVIDMTRFPSVSVKPEDHLRSLLKLKGLSIDAFEASDHAYLAVEANHIECYPQVAKAARTEDLGLLKSLYREGTNLQCANTYGESIVHIICRRGSLAMLDFVLNEAKVSLRVRDDMGRTPLHDAAWTVKPNFELVCMILNDSPDFLLTKDKRGHTPLSYVPRSCWSKWCLFLDEHAHYIDAVIESKHLKSV